LVGCFDGGEGSVLNVFPRLFVRLTRTNNLGLNGGIPLGFRILIALNMK
jgi:hypothetical protein